MGSETVETGTVTAWIGRYDSIKKTKSWREGWGEGAAPHKT